MATAKPLYDAGKTITMDVSSLATSSTFVAGLESGEIDNTSNRFMDAIVNVAGINGHASTAPTVGQMIRLFVWGGGVSLATTPIDTLDGTSSGETLSHVSVLNSLHEVPAAVVTVATANLKYYFQPFSVCEILGLRVLPRFWGLFLAHNHTGALAGSQPGLFTYDGVHYDIA